MSERKLATIRKINKLVPIKGADTIEVATVDGWHLVVKTGEFAEGDLCVYFEIDSYLPLRPEFEFLRARCFKKMGNLEGLRLRTIRLRGQVSQGLALPMSVLGKQHEIFTIGTDVTADLGVTKYEPPIPVQLAGQVRGNFPTFIKKTDQDRCQNIYEDIFVTNATTSYEVSMKLDGTSFTGYQNTGDTGVCGRNWNLAISEKNEGNSLVRMFVDSKLQDALIAVNRNIAVQGELMGPGIQGNRESLTVFKLFVFDIFNIDTGVQYGPLVRMSILDELYAAGLDCSMVQHVPIFENDVTLQELGINCVADLLSDAEGQSLVHPISEGKVYKSLDGQFTFKAISNKFLLKEQD